MKSFLRLAFCLLGLMWQEVGFCYPFGPEPEEIADNVSFLDTIVIVSFFVSTVFYLYCFICEHTKIEHPCWTAIAIICGIVGLEGYFFKTNARVPVSLIIMGIYSMYKIHTYKGE